MKREDYPKLILAILFMLAPLIGLVRTLMILYHLSLKVSIAISVSIFIPILIFFISRVKKKKLDTTPQHPNVKNIQHSKKEEKRKSKPTSK